MRPRKVALAAAGKAALTGLASLAGVLMTLPAWAQSCTRQGDLVTCSDGRAGTFAGDAIVWTDGTTSRAGPHPSVIIGNKPSIQVGQGVFVGRGRGVVPLDDPNTTNKRQCAVLDGVSYCD